MRLKKFYLLLLLSLIFFSNNSFSNNHNIGEILELIQKDIKTLERAVYAQDDINDTNDATIDQNSEDVLTRHLLKLTEIN